MMFALTLLPVFLSITAFASPTTFESSGCSTAGAVVDVPSGQTVLVPISEPVSFIALGVGVQNYTCASTGTYSSVGALAELVDISCLYKNKQLFAQLPDYAIELWSKAPSSITTAELISELSILNNPIILGQHYFITNPVTGSGVSAKWDFSSHLHNSSAVVVGARTGDLPAPTGPQDVDWLSLSAVPGQGLLADQVFRTDTRLGQPPASCVPGSADISVKYVANYWFLGGAFGQK